MAGLPPHPQPSPFGSLGIGEVEGHSTEVRDPISNDRETRRLEDAGAGLAAASAGRQPLPAGLARGTLGAMGWAVTDARRAGRGIVASGSDDTETCLSYGPDPLSLSPRSLSPFRARWRGPPLPPGRATQSPSCHQAPPLTEAEAESQNPEGKQLVRVSWPGPPAGGRRIGPGAAVAGTHEAAGPLLGTMAAVNPRKLTEPRGKTLR